MKNILSLLIIFFAVCTNDLICQIDGDNLFAEDQIVNIELEFAQENFWDSLTTNYETSTYMKADLTITDLTGTYSFDDVGVRLKGNSSYGHPGNKKSLKIDFNKYVSGQDYDGIKKLNFSNAFKDPSLLREKVFFDMCREAGVPAPRANFANVYFNGTLWGFYTLVEQIDDQFLDWKIEDDDGNLFKAGANFGGGPGGGGNEADLVYYGEDQADYEERYELKSNENENDWSDLIAFTDFINNSSDAEFEEELKDHLEVDEYLTSIALDNLFSNLDSYTGSARNYYIYHNLTTEKWEWIKWDANETFGSYRAGGGPGQPMVNMTSLPLNYHNADRPLLERVFDSEKLYLQYQKEVCHITDKFFDPSLTHDKIDALKALIQESVYADTNKMYSDADFDTNVESNISGGGGGPNGGTTYGLKSFIDAKSTFIANELDCSALTSTKQIVVDPVSIYPNPAKDNITLSDLDLLNGNILIINQLGLEVMNLEVKGDLPTYLDIRNLASGVYFIEVQDIDDKTISRPMKLIKI